MRGLNLAVLIIGLTLVGAACTASAASTAR
jgi:hypothetical protein